jgi:DtxR family Mn-dependent transcriptional regulator
MRPAEGSVDPVDTDSISAVAQDYVKAIWSATEWGDPPITTKGLASRFGTSAANVTDTVRRLAGLGLIDYEPYKPVHLTATGTTLAIAMVRRHRLIETFLVTVLGYRWDEIHDEAERLEHAASDTLIDRIDTLLGHPAADPHGDPIPTPDGHTRTIEGAVRLSDAGSGSHLIHRISDAEPGNLTAAAALGITPGAVIDTRFEDDAVILRGPHGQRRIPDEVASATWTTRAS